MTATQEIDFSCAENTCKHWKEHIRGGCAAKQLLLRVQDVDRKEGYAKGMCLNYSRRYDTKSTIFIRDLERQKPEPQEPSA